MSVGHNDQVLEIILRQPLEIHAYNRRGDNNRIFAQAFELSDLVLHRLHQLLRTLRVQRKICALLGLLYASHYLLLDLRIQRHDTSII